MKRSISLPSQDLGQAEVLESLWINLMVPPTHFGIMGVDVKLTNLIVIHCRAAGDSLVKVMKRFPNLVKKCIPMLTSSLQDTGAIEETAIGACQILTSRSVLRHLLQVGICFKRMHWNFVLLVIAFHGVLGIVSYPTLLCAGLERSSCFPNGNFEQVRELLSLPSLTKSIVCM